MNASLYSCCLRVSKQEQTLYPGEPNNGNLRYVSIVTFETEVANFENDIASEKRPYTAKIGVLNLTPVGVNRGPHPQVLTLHPRVST